MPRANRTFMPGYVWHITERCHDRRFLLRFARDRRRWRHWLFEAKKRFALCVLNYTVTSNHIHLLVRDQGRGEISDSLQLIASQTAREYNRRKSRRGAFWEDRYHATCVDSDAYLARCMVYIDLNMVRAGRVTHPEQWDVCGYREIQALPQRYRIIDQAALCMLLGAADASAMRTTHKEWVEATLAAGALARDECWTESPVVGSREFVSGYLERAGTADCSQWLVERADGLTMIDAPDSLARRFEGNNRSSKASKRAV